MKFETIKSETVYRGRAFTARRDLVRTPSQREVWLDIIEHIGSVILVPVDAEGRILFVRQYRHATAQDVLELPAGTLEIGEDPAECAGRELREETGMAAESIVKLGQFYLAPGYSTELMHVYFATDLRPDPLEADVDEYLDVVAIPAAEAYARMTELVDSKTLAALLFAREKILGK